MLQDFAPAHVYMNRPGVFMAFGYPSAMHCFLRARLTYDLFKNLAAIVWMYGGIAVTVKNNCGNRRTVTENVPSTGNATLTHGGER